MRLNPAALVQQNQYVDVQNASNASAQFCTWIYHCVLIGFLGKIKENWQHHGENNIIYKLFEQGNVDQTKRKMSEMRKILNEKERIRNLKF